MLGNKSALLKCSIYREQIDGMVICAGVYLDSIRNAANYKYEAIRLYQATVAILYDLCTIEKTITYKAALAYINYLEHLASDIHHYIITDVLSNIDIEIMEYYIKAIKNGAQLCS